MSGSWLSVQSQHGAILATFKCDGGAKTIACRLMNRHTHAREGVSSKLRSVPSNEDALGVESGFRMLGSRLFACNTSQPFVLLCLAVSDREFVGTLD